MSGPTERRAPRRVALIVLGSIVGLLALASLAGGGTVLWADQTQRDSSGLFSQAGHRVATDSYAVTQDGMSVHHLPGLANNGKLLRVRIDARSETGRPVFVGVARDRDVATYLAHVRHSKLRDYTVATSDQQYDSFAGTRRPSPPAKAGIWAASTTDSAPLTWKVRNGDWTVVLMNADGSQRVAADVKLGFGISYLGRLTIGLLAFGAAMLALAVFLIMRGGRRGRSTTRPSQSETPDLPRPAVRRTYPIVLTARLDEPLSRGLWLVKWLLMIPHLIVLALLWAAFTITTVVAWFAVVTTGRYPRSIFDFNVGVLRWTWRVSYYSYSALGTDRYPPFSLDAELDYPATLDVAYPEKQSRLSAFARLLLAFPHLLIIGVFVGGGAYWLGHLGSWGFTSPWSGLIGLLVLVAAVALLFTGRYPRGLFDLIIGLNRWVFRVIAYAALMTDEYPPFRYDGGGDEPQRLPTTTAAAHP